jgi:hypothetical protein
MPVDDIIPSREKADYQARMQANMASAVAAQQSQQPESATPTGPDGAPKGGMDANTVQNRSSGQAA